MTYPFVRLISLNLLLQYSSPALSSLLLPFLSPLLLPVLYWRASSHQMSASTAKQLCQVTSPDLNPECLRVNLQSYALIKQFYGQRRKWQRKMIIKRESWLFSGLPATWVAPEVFNTVSHQRFDSVLFVWHQIKTLSPGILHSECHWTLDLAHIFLWLIHTYSYFENLYSVNATLWILLGDKVLFRLRLIFFKVWLPISSH